MGIADVIPGISGGTIAFILGIYEELINAVRSFDLTFVKLLFQFKIKEAFDRASWQFLGSVLAGIAASIFTFSHIISYLMENYPIFHPLYNFYFDLIADLSRSL